LVHPAICPAAGTVPAYGWFGLGVQFYPESRGPGISASSKGAIRKDGSIADLTGGVAALGVGVKDDTLNQLLWAFWYGGAFDLDLSAMVADVAPKGTQLSVSAALPPVVMAGADGYDVRIGMGDMLVRAEIDLAQFLGDFAQGSMPFSMEAYVSMVLGGSIDIDSVRNELHVLVDEDIEAVVQIVSIDDVAAPYRGELGELMADLMRDYGPELLRDAASVMPIPALETGGLPYLPDNVYWGLGNADIRREASYLALTGNLVTRLSDVPVSSSNIVWPYACQ
jgi:hypothetical protein